MPVVKWADKVVSKAKAGGMKIPEPELDVKNASEKWSCILENRPTLLDSVNHMYTLTLQSRFGIGIVSS